MLVAAELPVPVPVGKGLKVSVGDSVGEPVSELVGLGEAEHEGEGVAVAVALAEGDGVAVGEALAVEVQLEAAATATPPNGPVNPISATEISKVAVPVARPTSPTRCNFSQLPWGARRKIVTISWEVRDNHQDYW